MDAVNGVSGGLEGAIRDKETGRHGSGGFGAGLRRGGRSRGAARTLRQATVGYRHWSAKAETEMPQRDRFKSQDGDSSRREGSSARACCRAG
jgi:hypothetical protein